MTTMATARSAKRTYATVPKLWPGETFVCVASGPSLTQEDVDYCRGKARVIAVNDNYKLAPWADVLYAADEHWWRWHHGVPSFHGLKFSIEASQGKATKHAQILKNCGHEGLELRPHGLRTGRNSGYQAVNLAVHLGAARIVLIGYDMKCTGGKTHWFGEHPIRQEKQYATFLTKFETLVQPLANIGVDVINCTRETALLSFPRKPLREVL
jgi:hypothetical protein